MKIRSKLNLALIAITMGGLIGLGLMYNAIMINSQMQLVVDRFDTLILSTYKLADKTNQIMTSKVNMKAATDELNAAIADYETNLNTLIADPEVQSIFKNVESKQYQDDLKAATEQAAQQAIENPNDPPPEVSVEPVQLIADKITGFWKYAKGQYTEALENIDWILSTDLIDGATKTGVLRLIAFLTGNNAPENTGGVLTKLYRVEQPIINVNDVLISFNRDIISPVTESAKTISQERVAGSILTAIIITIGLAMLGLIVVAIFNTRLVKRIYSLEIAMRTVSEKDLTHSINDKVRDEVGKLGGHINSSIESLSFFIGEVQTMVQGMEELKKILAKSSQETSSAITEISQNIEGYQQMFDRLENSQSHSTESVNRIAQSIDSLNQNIENQARAIMTVSNAIHKTNESIKSIANITSEQNQKTGELSKVITDGGEFVGKTNDSINTIARELTDINEIISIINTISDQTNLLSMNAAIESAHAGEAGKGFSIVAEEIRKLADSTAENAKRISEIILSITEQISEAKTNSEQSASTFDFIRNDVSEFTKAFNQISEGMTNLIQSSNEIVRTNQTIETGTATLRNESSAISLDAQDIKKEMMTLSNISSEVISGFNEIEAGTTDMLKNQLELREISLSVADQVEKLYTLISEFKVGTPELEEIEIPELEEQTEA